ncbi:MAG: deoxyribonuclease IV [Desulfovibrionaceae bacterium]|nr:deoxyribonuclease IV [Desulfovibrionaceae bacterium]
MIYIGCHLSVALGYPAMVENMCAMGGNTFAYFTRNPRGGKAKEVSKEDVQVFNQRLESEKFGPLVAHASYTMNLCAANLSTRANSLSMLREDLERLKVFPHNFYNFHPGSHVGQGVEEGIKLIAQALNQVLSAETNTIVLLETMAGKGTEIGSTFEELREIRDQVNFKEKVGVCFDTCHTHDAGYDVVRDIDGVLTQFDKIIGLDHLKAVHFNDSKNGKASHKDRHELLGQGQLGLEALKRIAKHKALANRPFILETPNDEAGYKQEIALVKSWFRE